MDRKKNAENRFFNAHTGAAAGLIIGVILGSLLLNLADGVAGRREPAVQRLVEHAASTAAHQADS
jgi:hypothetical protein